MQPATMNQHWYETVSNLINTDMRANPSTDKISQFFTKDALFYFDNPSSFATFFDNVCSIPEENLNSLDLEGPINKDTFLKIYKIAAEDNVVAMYSPQENKVSQVGEDEEAYMRWEIVESIQERIFSPQEIKRKIQGEQVKPTPAVYRVKYIAHLYLNEEAKIYKSIQMYSSIERIDDIGSQIANNCNNEVLQV